MALRFSYRQLPISNPAFTLGEAMFRPRPVVSLSVTASGGTIVEQMLVDSGADEIVLPDRDAMRIGIDLTNAPQGTSGGVGSPMFVVRYALVTLRLSDGNEHRIWDAIVGFASIGISRGLFGYAHGLQYFTTKLDGLAQEVELERNSTYPGS